MGLDDKLDQAKGTMKERVGKATDNRRLQAEGKAQKAKGKAVETFDKAKKKLTDR